MSESDNHKIDDVIFHGQDEADRQKLDVLLEQYKLFVDTSERLVARRQLVNTFFLSVNALVLTALALILKETTVDYVSAIGIISVSVAAIVLCFAWRSLVRSYRQLNEGKFKVIRRLERELPAAVFHAEWVELGEGKNPVKYKPFTSTEKGVSLTFVGIYCVVILVTGGWQIYNAL